MAITDVARGAGGTGLTRRDCTGDDLRVGTGIVLSEETGGEDREISFDENTGGEVDFDDPMSLFAVENVNRA